MTTGWDVKEYVVEGETVRVETFDAEAAAVRLVAGCGDVTMEATHNFSPVDGALVAPSAEAVQQSLDQARERLARAAAHRAVVLRLMAAAR